MTSLKSAALVFGLGAMIAGCGGESTTVLCSQWAAAIDSVRVQGTVKCGASKQVVSGTKVSIGSESTTCDTAGRFELTVADGPHTLVVAAPGFGEYSEEIEVQPGKTTLCSEIHLPKP